MIVVDVNPLIYAFRSGSPFHESARALLTQARAAGELVVLPEVAASFLRITTDPRLAAFSDDPRQALGFLEALTVDGRFIREARQTRWARFQEVVKTHDLRGAQVPDGMIAAACLDFGASVLTADRDFLTFPGLRVQLMTALGVVDHLVM